MLLKYGCATLRAIEEKDCDLLLEMMNNPEVDEYVGSVHLPISRSMQENWIKNYSNTENTIRLMIELENGYTIGMIMLQNIDYINKNAEIGIKTYVPDYTYRMKHDTEDAIYAMLYYAYNYLNLECIYGYVINDNRDAIKFNKRLGLHEDGTIRNKLYVNGEYKDMTVFSMLRNEFYSYIGNCQIK